MELVRTFAIRVCWQLLCCAASSADSLNFSASVVPETVAAATVEVIDVKGKKLFKGLM